MSFEVGQRVEPRQYLVNEHPDLDGRAGTVLAEEARGVKTLYTVAWDGLAGGPLTHPGSALKPSKIPPPAGSGSNPATAPFDGSRDHLVASNGSSEEARSLPGEPGHYLVVFASQYALQPHPDDVTAEWSGEMLVWGTCQTDAALRASHRRDTSIAYRKKEDEAKPHDRVLQSLFRGAKLDEEVAS